MTISVRTPPMSAAGCRIGAKTIVPSVRLHLQLLRVGHRIVGRRPLQRVDPSLRAPLNPASFSTCRHTHWTLQQIRVTTPFSRPMLRHAGALTGFFLCFTISLFIHDVAVRRHSLWIQPAESF